MKAYASTEHLQTKIKKIKIKTTQKRGNLEDGAFALAKAETKLICTCRNCQYARKNE